MRKSFNDIGFRVRNNRANVDAYTAMLNALPNNRKDSGIWPIETAMNSHINCENLAHWLIHNIDPLHPVYDLGCGKGFYLQRLSENGFKFLKGFEGTPDINLISYCPVEVKDITKPIRVPSYATGTVLCFEVMEHIEKEFSDAVMENFRRLCNGRLVLSWAIPGQGGIGHVNERDADYVIPYARKFGFALHNELTLAARDRAGQEIQYFGKSIYVFSKVE